MQSKSIYSDIPEDVQKFLDRTVNGSKTGEYEDIYRFLGREAGDGEKDRVTRKRKTFTMLYDIIRFTSPYFQALQKHFPTVAQYMMQQKSVDYREFSRLEQRVESSYIYDCVVRRLIKTHPKMPIITVHDSILTTEPYLDILHSTMIECAMEEYGTVPKLELQDYRERE